MNKKVIGYIIAALVIGSMIAIMVNNNLNKPEPIDTTGIIVGTGGEASADEELEVGLLQGNLPPDFELNTLAGETVRLSDLKGKKVVLNFWATWCPPCKAEMPHMEKYYSKNAEKDNVEILSVNLTTGENRGVKAVQEFIDAYELTFTIPLDEQGIVGDTYQVYSIPTTFMLNTDGTISQKIVGPMDESIMEQLVEDLY
ncbi:TlpA disulfide reductase family protein [Sporosarcina oncorhynchi]|uniref:TlpA disulfide reductase family protein n=1 Tax=Sporosarcina oncorhynchi TaxID=3056444 RepID=A0ABZ0L763_9BACL|nr:TlpA disulfide reductase family protein [Sporosarcina sp. T2O-4]WOV88402.1 TlpA disulfide reductase family protein [Sporosarcina sp. T2O-4]